MKYLIILFLIISLSLPLFAKAACTIIDGEGYCDAIPLGSYPLPNPQPNPQPAKEESHNFSSGSNPCPTNHLIGRLNKDCHEGLTDSQFSFLLSWLVSVGWL